MSGRKQTGINEDTAANMTKSAAKPKRPTVELEALKLEVPTSAEAMATALTQLADDLRRGAEQLKGKKKGHTLVLPICIRFYCNGGGDG